MPHHAAALPEKLDWPPRRCIATRDRLPKIGLPNAINLKEKAWCSDGCVFLTGAERSADNRG
jgi:hypothetical protein